MTLFNRLFNGLVFWPIISLMVLALSPLILISWCADQVTTGTMTAEEKRRHYATWEPY